MKNFDFDLFVIGAGSGGVRAGRMAAATGARVAVAECGPLGGTCVNLGCVPKKLLVYASQMVDSFEDAAGFGFEKVTPEFSWNRLISDKDREIKRLNGIYRRLLDNAGVTLIEGRARVAGEHTVEVAGRRYDCDRILVATGGRPSVPEIPGSELGITSDETFHLAEFPKRVVIVGGGYIAVEFAGIFNGLGAEVTQLYRGPLFLRGFDDDLRTTLAEAMAKRGVTVRFETNAVEIAGGDEGLIVTTTEGDSIAADQVLFATGRVPNTEGLGLEEVGVKLGNYGEVLVDEFSATSVPNIHAVGDCTDRLNLTPVAIDEAMAYVATEFRGLPTPTDHTNVATAVFSQPNLATVGLTEREAREKFVAVDVYRSAVRSLKNAMTGRDEKTMMKILVDRDTDKILGMHMVGCEAGEIIQGMAVAVKCGLTKTQLDSTVAIHPTAAEEFVTMREPVE